MILDAGTIYAQASSLYDFARELRRSTVKKLPWAGVVTGLHLMDVREGGYADLFAMLGRFAARKQDPERFANRSGFLSAGDLWLSKLKHRVVSHRVV